MHNIIVVCIDEGSDKEASMEESESEKSTEDEETSESETVSGSESEEVRSLLYLQIFHAPTVESIKPGYLHAEKTGRLCPE